MLADYIKEHNEMIEANKIDIELKYKPKPYSTEDECQDKLLDKIAFDIDAINTKFGKNHVNIKICISQEES